MYINITTHLFSKATKASPSLEANSRLDGKLTAFYGNQRFFTVSRPARQLIISQATLIYSSTQHFTIIRRVDMF
jgi:hypothetical protein